MQTEQLLCWCGITDTEHNTTTGSNAEKIFTKMIFLKGRVHCFTMQVVISKCFLLNPEKFGADPSCCFREKSKISHFNSEK